MTTDSGSAETSGGNVITIDDNVQNDDFRVARSALEAAERNFPGAGYLMHIHLAEQMFRGGRPSVILPIEYLTMVEHRMHIVAEVTGLLDRENFEQFLVSAVLYAWMTNRSDADLFVPTERLLSSLGVRFSDRGELRNRIEAALQRLKDEQARKG